MANLESKVFGVKPCESSPIGTEVKDRIPAHKLVIEPLVAISEEVCVFQKRSYDIEVPLPPGKKVGADYVLDLSVEVVQGWEEFWNSGMWKRGAITIKLDGEAIDWSEIFQWTEYIGIWASKYQIFKSTPKAAVSYAERHSTGNSVVVCLSASNGMDCLNFWAAPKFLQELQKTAEDCCRPFVSHVAQGTFDREIIYNRAPYQDQI